MIKWFERNHRVAFLASLIVAGIIFYLSSVPAESLGVGGGELKPIFYHFGAFFILSLFLSIGLSKGKELKFVAAAIVIVAVYSISDEIHQFFTPGRSISLFDIFIDSLGNLSAAVFYLIKRF